MDHTVTQGDSESDIKHGFLALSLDFANEKAFSVCGPNVQITRCGVRRTPPKLYLSWTAYVEEEPEHVVIQVREGSAEQYPVLDFFLVLEDLMLLSSTYMVGLVLILATSLRTRC